MARDPPASNFPGDLAQNQAPAGVYSYHVGSIDALLGPRGYAQRTIQAYACRAGTPLLRTWAVTFLSPLWVCAPSCALVGGVTESVSAVKS